MQIQPLETAKQTGPYEHRPGGITVTPLLAGTEFAPDNFGLWIVDTTDDYFTPRHRHNFDQVRIMLNGRYGWSPEDVQEEGTVGYFTEGTYYTQMGKGESRTLLLQVAGASGQGYMSLDQLDRGIQELKTRGTFKDGVYTWFDEDGGKHNKDGHEAVWEHTFAKPVAYQKPRFDAPIFIRPEQFGWLPAAADGRARIRRFGVLNERGLEIGEAALDAGATLTFDAGDKPRIAFVMSGSGTAGGDAWRTHTAILAERGETIDIEAETDSGLYLFGLPTFDDVPMQGAQAAE